MTQQFITSDQKTIQTADNKIFIVQKDHKEGNQMARKFQFKILTGATEAECKARYDNEPLTDNHHDPYTFYLFDKGGIGYLGDTPLFGGDASKFNLVTGNKSDLKPNSFYFVTTTCTLTDPTNEGAADPTTGVHNATAGSIWVTDNSSIPQELSLTIFTHYLVNSAIHSNGTNLPDGDHWDATFAGNDTTVLTSAATKVLINNVVNNQAILSISFLKNVEIHTITQAEVNAGKITCFTDKAADITSDDHKDDIGIVFQFQAGATYDESTDTNDICVFFNLHSLIKRYIGSDTDTTEVIIAQDLTADPSGHTEKITVNVKESEKTATALENIIMGAFNTVYQHKQDPETYPNDYDKTNLTDALAQHRFITESQLVDILGHVLTHFAEVVWVSGGGEGMEEGDDN